MIKRAIFKTTEGLNLSEDEMLQAMDEIVEGKATASQVASFLTALKIKGETIDEIAGAARSLRKKSTPIRVKNIEDLIDTCGTGGDQRQTFNISTAVAFVVAGAGLKVAKHGNRSVSSRCGSADVMEALGIKIDISSRLISRCIEEIGIGFLFAPRLNKAMNRVLTVRREIGIRTIFNILGPLTNPAGANIHILGVYDGRMTEIMAKVLRRLGAKRAIVVHGLDGLDEISICAETVVSELKNNQITTYRIHPIDCGFPIRQLKDIQGGDAKENAAIILEILKGKKGPPREIVLLNAGAALMIAGKAKDIKEGIKIASHVIDKGLAIEKLEQLKKMTKGK